MKRGILIILDGYGEGKPNEFNAVKNADSPFLHSLREKSYSILGASGEDVGLIKGELGGSEVGHMTIGTGKINPSTFNRINDDITSGDYEKNKTLVSMLKFLKTHNSNLHLIGLMSDKNIHSNINFTLKTIELSKDYAKNIFVHFITDGRDSGPFDSLKYLEMFKKKTKSISNCHILSVSGRFYSMDRESYLDRIRLSMDAMFNKNNEINEEDISVYLKAQHKAGKNDQNILPVHVYSNEYDGVSKDDVLFFTNFRADRMVEIVDACSLLPAKIFTMIEVKDRKQNVLYPAVKIKHNLSEYLSNLGLKQIKISETTKYAHVTYFLNGGIESPYPNEDRIHIKTRKTTDYAKYPKMQAGRITKAVLKSIKKGYDAIIVNFSNPDMIGHTGNYLATKFSIEYIDKCVKKIVNLADKVGYKVLLTADHGNSDLMRTPTGEPHTAHTLSPVMCVVANGNVTMDKSGGLKDVAPTFIDLMELKPYKYFDGKSLINHIDKTN